MSVKLGVVRGAISLGSARVLINILNAASIMVLARLLTPTDFGIIAIATSLLSVTMSLTEASFPAALVQRPKLTREYIDTVWSMSLLRAGAIFGLFAILARPLATAYGDSRLVSVLIVTGVTGAFMDFSNPLITRATREMRFGPTMLFQISQKLVGVALALGLALLFRSFWAIIIGNAVGAITASLLSYALFPYRPRFTLAHAREIWGFSGWMFINQLCETLNWRFDQLVIGLTVPTAAMGRYAVADSLAVIPSREISVPLREALFVGMAAVNRDVTRLRQSYLRAQSTIEMLTAPAAVGLALAAEPAVRVMLGDKWLDCVLFVQILSISYAMDAFVSVARPLAMAMGQTKYQFLRQLFALGFRIPLILVGLFTGGLVGAAIGRTVSGLINFLISLLIARKLVDLSIREQLRSHVVTLVGLLVMSGAVLACDAVIRPLFPDDPLLTLLLLGSFGAIAYSACLVGLWLGAGRPDGAVSEVFALFARFDLLSRARTWLGRPASTLQESIVSPPAP